MQLPVLVHVVLPVNKLGKTGKVTLINVVTYIPKGDVVFLANYTNMFIFFSLHMTHNLIKI